MARLCSFQSSRFQRVLEIVACNYNEASESWVLNSASLYSDSRVSSFSFESEVTHSKLQYDFDDTAVQERDFDISVLLYLGPHFVF